MRTLPFVRPTIARLSVRRGDVGVRDGYYRVHDVGNPMIGHPGYTEASLINFNNTGQILGSVSEPRGTDSVMACTVYTGGRFIDVPTQSTSHLCLPESMSDADPKTGAFSIVGARQWPFAAYDFGFVANVSPLATTMHDYLDAASIYTNVNDNGVVTGFATGDDNEAPAGLVTTTTSDDWNVFEPPCPSYDCYQPLFAYPFPSRFHSGSLNDAGIVLASFGGVIGYVKLSPPYTAHTLVTASEGGEELNNANQIAYLTYTQSLNVRVAIISIASGRVVDVPPIPNSTCKDYYKINLTDFGGIFGVAANCGPSSPVSEIYYLYDPIRGTRVFAPVIVDSAPLQDFAFFAENDNGQILFTATNSITGQRDWGTLDPLTSRPTPRRP